jgi:hypothetical protein
MAQSRALSGLSLVILKSHVATEGLIGTLAGAK